MSQTETGLTPTTERAPVRLGLAPTSIEEGWRLAQMMAKSELVPKNFRGKPEDVLVAIQMGIEIGFAPMQALQSIAVINGRPGVWGDGFLALLMASPLYQDHDEYFEVAGQRCDGLTVPDLKDATTAAVCTFWRHGKAMPVTRRFTVAQAMKANLLGKQGPWQEYPDRMLQMRARSFAGRDCFPDLLRGMKTAEELRDTPELPASEPAPRMVQRISETPRAMTANGSTAASAVRSTPATGSTPSPVVSAPPPAAVIVGLVAETSRAGGGPHAVTLTTGECIAVEREADLIELAKFVGTEYALRLTCVMGDDQNLYLQSFAIAD